MSYITHHDLNIRPLSLDINPLEAAARWPIDRPLVMLHSGRVHPRWARWSILASPAVTYRFDVRSHWVGLHPIVEDVRFTHDPLKDVDAILAVTRRKTNNTEAARLPFCGGWIGYFAYDLGGLIEPAARLHGSKPADSSWPLVEFAYCPDAMVYDNVEDRWHGIGNPIPLDPVDVPAMTRDVDFQLGPIAPSTDPDRYMSMVGRTIQYIEAGDVFQANIAQCFQAAFSGSGRGLALEALRASQPWYGAYLELAVLKSGVGRSLLSLSPELFLCVDPQTRQVTTRPIKGTRPSSVDATVLRESPKDVAELHMIIDLMRNDLGRVCEFGSVHVPTGRMVESHPTIHHGVGEVHGTLRENVTFGNLIRAAFPGGSVTGAPKIRAMQIIDELEPFRHGAYCGSIGAISDDGSATLNIAIRTLMLEGLRHHERLDHLEGTMTYPAGAGIVADSDPLSEYRETLDKAAVLRMLTQPQGATGL